MTFFEKEMRKIFEESEFLSSETKFFDKTMISKIGEGLIAKVEFCSFSHADHYTGIRLSIINKKDGVVDSQNFKFEDMCGVYRKNPIGIIKNGNDAFWNVYKPTNADYEKIKDTIEDYIKMYSDIDISENQMRM